MIGASLRRAAIFGAVAGLGIALAWILAGDRRGSGGRKPSVPVVRVPPGTEIQGPGSVPGISLVEAEKVRVSPVLDVVLDDGTKVAFRSMVLRADAESPLPSPSRGVRRAALVRPVVLLLPVPRTRAQYEAAATAVPTRMEAPEGVLESGPGERNRLLLRGGVRVESFREGTPWVFTGEEAEADLQARTLRAPGAVSIDSKGIHVEGRGLEAEENARTAVLASAARGSVAGSRGARIAGGAAGGETRFRCSGPLRLLPREAAPGQGRGGSKPGPLPEKVLIVLEREAVLEQEEGSLAADRIELDLRRATGGTDEGVDVEEVRADGNMVLAGGRGGRDFRAEAGSLRARPLAGGANEVILRNGPTATFRDPGDGGRARTVVVTGSEPARCVFPGEAGPVEALFRGDAAAVLLEPGAAPDAPTRRRDLRAAAISLHGTRGPDGRTSVGSVAAEGDAQLTEPDRSARAGRIVHNPRDDGGSRTELDGAVLVTWPGAGSLDPVGAVAPGPVAATEGGTMLLSTPDRAVLDLPPDGDTSRGARFEVGDGAVLRRVLGEREIYRLACARAEGATQPGNRGLDALLARGSVRIEGREEGPGGRRYDLRGESLDVRGAEGTREARSAELRGVPGKSPASARFDREDGRPMAVDADTLRFDRTTGAFRAEGNVHGRGVLPEGRGAGPVAPRARGGQAEVSCAALDGVLARGTAEGSTRVVSLDARGGAVVSTEAEKASGDSLRYDAAEGTVVLLGDPARVTARSAGAAAALGLEDACEAPELLLSLEDGVLREARSAAGGTFVGHRAGEARAPGSPVPPPERIEARCRGPFAYGPAETVLTGKVVMVRSDLVDGAFREKDRMEGADDVRIRHGAARGGTAVRVEGATATSASGALDIASASAGWHATGVSRADFDVAGGRVLMESSASAPRFRVVGDASTQSFRRVVYDYDRRLFTEQVGATFEGGGK